MSMPGHKKMAFFDETRNLNDVMLNYKMKPRNQVEIKFSKFIIYIEGKHSQVHHIYIVLSYKRF